MSGLDEIGRSLKDAATSFAQGAKEVGSEFADGVGSVTNSIERTKGFAQVGSDLFLTGAVTSHGGNLSMTDGVNIWITHRDSMLGHLKESDISQTTWDISADLDKPCSRELIVHRAMLHGYAQREKLESGKFTAAVVHAHTRNTILRSLIADAVEPIDSEGLYVLGGTSVKVYAPTVTIESSEAADMLGQAVYYGANIAIIKGHGPFAVAPTIYDAFKLVSVLEASCEILNMKDAIAR